MRKSIKKTIIALIVFNCQLSIFNLSYAQTEVTQGVTFGKKFGVTYMLPQTEIKIEAEATRQHYEPGQFSKYAERYLRLRDVKQEAETSWTLDEVKVNIVGVPDPSNIYFVEMKDRTTAPLMELTADGIVRSINLPFTGDKKAEQPQAKQQEDEALPDPRTFLTEEILMTNSTAKMAELVAREIYSIRESKNALLRGEAENLPKDGAQLQIMLDNLNKQEKAMVQMFEGKVTTETHHFTKRVTPEEMSNHVVFRFSKKLGFVEADDLAGEPVELSIVNKQLIPEQPAEPEGKSSRSIISILTNGNKSAIEGVAYNVPGKADVKLTYQHKDIINTELSLTQFGTREYLADQLFNRNTVTQVLFDVNTGALLKIDRQ
ncbi:MAG: DUF4831 family protein [Bacteroidaceae bacterium]|jgi:hypothetical protein|nr:DUF4831 family protein [Bacteroidaceae bacterium]